MPSDRDVRSASHAGSWYTSSGPALHSSLDSWLAAVPNPLSGTGPLPVPRARIIIAPHAGYSYSGAAAAYAYASLDLSRAKRIFLLGPSHHAYLPGCALSEHKSYATPFGDLPLDAATIAALRSTGKFELMNKDVDEAEHSLEMHLPYIFHLLSRTFSSQASSSFPPLVPILVGSTSAASERLYGAILAPYIADKDNVFIVSSDFCHWGLRFSYTAYLQSLPPTTLDTTNNNNSSSSSNETLEGLDLIKLRAKSKSPRDPSIAESIGSLDRLAMDGIESGRHEGFLAVLSKTSNTVCGRHPIGVVMAALEALREQGKLNHDGGRFRFVRYERSSEVVDVADSSVSYASAYAVL
ncbi:MAG: hypothetical protein M1825_005150 [Sarcosagium campestre]|nr:MAG: hypothetical protein M1825_005150 [Sarcosagium campestre]